MKLLFHPAARDELRAAADWYDERVSGLGVDLLDVVQEAVGRIVAAPERYAMLPDEPRARRLVVESFPFSVVYTRVAGDSLFIVAVAHQRRRPRYWARRLDDTPPQVRRRR